MIGIIQVVLVTAVFSWTLRLLVRSFQRAGHGGDNAPERASYAVFLLLVGYHLLFSGNNIRPFAGIAFEGWSKAALTLGILAFLAAFFGVRFLARLLGIIGVIAVLIAALTANTRTFDWPDWVDDDDNQTAQTVEYNPTSVCLDGNIDQDLLNEERARLAREYSGDELDQRLDAVNALKPEDCPGAAHAAECQNTWALQEIRADNNRVLPGVDQIRTASTDEEAREAAHIWLNQIKPDPDLVVMAASYFLDRTVDRNTLVNGNCASDAAQQLLGEIELAFMDSRITPEDAPADGTNSGVDANGHGVAASEPGLRGDLSAIKIEKKDGSAVWILARCGNPVVQGPAPVPPGPTDNPPPSTTTSTVPRDTTTTVPRDTTTTTVPTTSTTLTPKDPSKDINNNPAVPPQVTKDQPSPDNQDRIDAGPTQPRDTPTGCDGPCPAPSTTSTTAPRQTSSSTTTPSCGQAGQPSCSNTGSPTPTTSEPAHQAEPDPTPNEGEPNDY